MRSILQPEQQAKEIRRPRPGSPAVSREDQSSQPDFHYHADNQAIQWLFRSGTLQASLAIGHVDDFAEHEADAIAAQITSPEKSDQSKATAPKVQHSAHSSYAGPSSTHVPGIVQQVLRSSGHALDSATRAFFESRFGRDFRDVRIHTDSHASASARSIQAHAYTAGSDIVFAPGQYSPDSDTGRRLLAHELTHILQQRTRPASPSVQRTSDETQPTGNSIMVSVQSNCPDAKARVIALAILKGQRMLNAALDWFRNSSPENDIRTKALLRSHFGSNSEATWNAVHQRLISISTILEAASNAHVNLNCLDPKDSVCSKNEFYAYVHPGQGYTINFCQEFFNMTAEEQVWGIIHETAHLAGAHGDNYIFVFGAMDASACYGQSALTSSPLGNADSYTSFVWCLVSPDTVVHPESPPF